MSTNIHPISLDEPVSLPRRSLFHSDYLEQFRLPSIRNNTIINNNNNTNNNNTNNNQQDIKPTICLPDLLPLSKIEENTSILCGRRKRRIKTLNNNSTNQKIIISGQ